jgi:hypothetical protein
LSPIVEEAVERLLDARGAGYRVTAVTAVELALGRAYRDNPRPVHAERLAFRARARPARRPPRRLANE